MADGGAGMRALLQRLVAAGQLEAADVEAATTRLRQAGRTPHTPWYLQPFIFFGTLLAAALISIGVAQAFEIRWQGTEMVVMGAIYLGAALVLHRLRRNLFMDYMGLALSIAGHAIALAGVADLWEQAEPAVAMFLVSLGLSVLLYGLYRDFLHRFASCLLVFVLGRVAFAEHDLGDLLHVVVAVLASTCAGLLTRSRENPVWRPLAYASACGLLAVLMPISERGLWSFDRGLPHPWIASAICGIALLATMHWSSRRSAALDPGSHVTPRQRALATVIVVGLASLGTPGIPAALFLIVLGHATFHWPVTAVALASLPVFLWKYYYALDLDVVAKSGVLVASGMLLLVARLAVRRVSGAAKPSAASVGRTGFPWLVLLNLVVFLAVANGLILGKERHLEHGRTVLLECTIDDFRSPEPGAFVTLRYPICEQIHERLGRDARGEGHVVLDVDASRIGRLRRIHSGGDLGAGEVLLRYKIRWGRGIKVRVAAEEYVFQEGSAEEFAGVAYAELRLDAEGRALLMGLCDAERQRVGRPKR